MYLCEKPITKKMERFILTTKEENGCERIVCRGTNKDDLRHVGESFKNYELYEAKLIESNLNTGR